MAKGSQLEKKPAGPPAGRPRGDPPGCACVPVPPATGTWHLVSVNGVIDWENAARTGRAGRGKRQARPGSNRNRDR